MPILDGRDPASLDAAAERLAVGDLLAFPTETVYGLGARADDDAAVARIFDAKGRPRGHPLIVHVADAAHAGAFAANWSALAQRLAAAFWPGPLTLIVPRRDGVAGAAAAQQPTIGLRCPAHALTHALLVRAAALGVPGVAGPSANRFGRPVLLRPGALTREALSAAAGQPIEDADAGAPRAAGTLEAHYAPRAALRLMPSAALADALAVWTEARTAAGRPPRPQPVLAVYSRTVRAPRGTADPALLLRAMPNQPRAAAFELFAALRELDATGVGLIWVEQPPPGSDWDGVRDRLERAAAAGRSA
jgi:L-threonylcarbamoyladenylate synthase